MDPDSALSEALVAVADGLDLSDTLQRILHSAVQLSGARYGALGILDEDGDVAQFRHIGMTDAEVATVGMLPQGRGLLGEVSRSTRPLRVRRIKDHPAAVGFPPGHPRMESFLGVPIVAAGRTFGRLYLTDKPGGFDVDDEKRVTTLAAAAGVAVENAQLFIAAHTGERHQAAAAAMSQAALAEDAGEVLEILCESARALVAADAAAVATITGEDLMVEVAALGPPCAPAQDSRPAPTPAPGDDRSRLEAAVLQWIADRAGLRPVSQCFRDKGPTVQRGEEPVAGDLYRQVACFPIASPRHDRVFGVLVLLWREASPRQPGRAADAVASLADHAATALSLDDARRAEDQLLVFRDRDRIARDLHDLVVQRLFASGMSLQVLARTHDLAPAARDRIDRVVADIDATIAQIRETIFELREGPANRQRLTDRLADEVAIMRDALGCPADLAVSAELTDAEYDDLVADIVAVVREGLSNAARHSGAAEVGVVIAADHQTLTVRVVDDGRGPSDPRRRSGLANLHHRAAARNGGCDLTRRAEGGAELNWRVPLPDR